MMSITTGDDVIKSIQLTKDNQAFSIAPTAIIKAAIIDNKKRKTLIAAGDVLSSTAGSNWASGLIVVTFASIDTALIEDAHTENMAWLEIQVDDNGKQTWVTPIFINRGTIA